MNPDVSQGKHIGLDPVMGTNPLSALTPNTPATVSPLILSSVVGSMQMGPCSS